MYKVFEVFLKAIPVFVIATTVLGYLHLASYYYLFDIKIINYIDFSEIPLLFFNTSILLMFFVLMVVVINFQILQKSQKKEIQFENELNKIDDIRLKQEKKVIREEQSKKSIRRIKLYVKIFSVLIVISGLITGLVFKQYISMTLILIFGIISFLLFEKIVKVINVGRERNQKEHFLLFFSIIYLFFTSLITLSAKIKESYDIKYGNKEIINTSFVYNEKKIKTDKKVKYIGETKNYIFLYDTFQKSTHIYKKEKVIDQIITN